jgi:signal transduction histidine kinase
MSRRSAVLLAIGVTLFAALTTVVGAASGAPARFLVLDATTGLTFVAAGLVAAWFRPASPAGLLLLVSGALWFVGSYGPTGRPVLTHLGFAFEGYYDLTLAVLLLLLSATARGLRPRSLVAVLAVAMSARSLGRLTLTDPAVFMPECTDCPSNPFALHADVGLFESVELMTNTVMAICFVLVAIVAASRLLSVSGAARRSRWPVLLAGTLAMAGAAYHALEYAWPVATGTGLLELEEPLHEVRAWLIFGLRVLVPIGFMVGVIQQRSRAGPLAPLATHLRGRDGSTSTGDAIRTALGDPSASLLRARQHAWTTEAGLEVPVPHDDPASSRAVTLIGSEPSPVAAIEHDRALLEQPELLEGVTTLVHLAIENERLEAELRSQLHEVTQSRARIVSAAEEERRRIERDLHDGAQQRLVAASLSLRDARALAVSAEAAAPLTESLDGLAHELAAAIRELRELARGIHPAILENEGLAAAVAGLARRSSVPVEVRVEIPGRQPAIVESTVYFTIAEALTNTQRYAHATGATVSVTAGPGRVEVAVSDDGVGGVDPARGSGLRGLADRVRALGGGLDIDSVPGSGTAIRAWIPLP